VKVSVIVPTHNRGDLLAETLAALVSQPFDSREIICVNDASTDDTAAVLASFGDDIQTIDVDFRCPAKTRNAGAAAARGEYLLFIDDDCLAPPDWIGTMVQHFEGEACSALAGGIDAQHMETRAERYQHYRMRLILGDHPKAVTACPVVNFLISREAFEAVGGFSEIFEFGLEDWEFCHRLTQQGYRIRYTPEVKVRHSYRGDWPLVRKRLMQTATGAITMCRVLGVSPWPMMARSTVKFLACPLWSIWCYPIDLYPMSIAVEAAFYGARLRAFLRSQ
jgi:GT2 family glycosyltransferase